MCIRDSPKCSTQSLLDTSADCLSLYWSMNNFNIRLAENKTALQGNLDPKILLESKDIIKVETHKLLEKFKNFPGYIFNLGHGLTPDICPNKVKYLTELVRDY